MNLTRISILVTAISVSILPIRAALEFAGFMTSEKSNYFLVTDRDAKNTSGWLSIGDSFAGHSVIAFDERNDTPFLRSSAGELRLPLKAAHVKTSELSPQRDPKHQEKMTRENMISMVIAPNGTIEDLEGMKLRLAALRPALRDAVFSHMQLPENAPKDGRKYQEFVLPARIAFDVACAELGLTHAGGQINPPSAGAVRRAP